ncbi:hypothetical protein N7454_002944 [Penicillium verhagenii]|nr:hypothetical protein N7454_002944 [Penicillium verhagenii]
MGNDLSTTSNKFGLLAGLLGNTSTTTCGLAGKRTVAIHCRGGWTWNNLFVFDGPLEPEDRYDGMKIAFGADGEIFKPYREGPGMSHEKLDGPAYNKLLLAVQSRRHSWEAHKDKSRVTNDAVRYGRAAPIWTWAVKQKFGLIVSGIYAVPSLFALPIVFVVKALIGDFLPAVIYLIIFAILKVYVHILLQVDRYVYYIQIAKDAM